MISFFFCQSFPFCLYVSINREIYPFSNTFLFQQQHGNTSHYCPLAITKKLVQLMLYFFDLEDFFWYSSLSNKMVALFVNTEKCKKQKPLEPNHCKEAITREPFQSDTTFLNLILPYSYLVRVRRIQFFYGKLLTYLSHRYNDTSFFKLYQQYSPRSLHQPCKTLDNFYWFRVKTQSEKKIRLL